MNMGARPFAFQKAALLLVLACLVVLLPCLYYPYSGVHPDFGFSLSLTDWKILTAPPCNGDACLQVGDQLISIEGVTRQQFFHDRSLSIPRLFGSDGVARVQILRDGELLTRDIKVRAKRFELQHFVITMVTPLIFWLMGTVAVIFLRPRDERWLVLVLFSYDTALWIASGTAQQAAWASYVFHAVIWFFLPLAVHLHTILPSELFSRRFRRWLLGTLYLAALGMAVLDALYLLQKLAFLFREHAVGRRPVGGAAPAAAGAARRFR